MSYSILPSVWHDEKEEEEEEEIVSNQSIREPATPRQMKGKKDIVDCLIDAPLCSFIHSHVEKIRANEWMNGSDAKILSLSQV